MNKFIQWRCTAVCMAVVTVPSMADTKAPEQKYPAFEVKEAPLEFRQFEKVEITGSAILAKEAKQALPLQTINRRDIERSGASNLSELLHQLPLMLNFQEQGTMTGSVAGGPEAAAIHGYQSGTLVLLNGRRLPYYGSQTISGERAIVDLNILPLTAIERIEMLTDGSSSRYGSDAVAGVVNIITKNNVQGTQVSAQYTAPRGGVASGQQLNLSWGQGKTERDGYSLQVHWSVEHQKALLAGDRPASKDALHRFNVNGKEYFDTVDSNQLFSLYGAPGYNVSTNGTVHNTYLDRYGRCPTGNYTYATSAQTYCFTNTQALYTVYPETNKQQLYLKGEKFIGQNWIGFSELILGQYTQDSVPRGYLEYDNLFPDGSAALMTATPLDVLRQRYQNNMFQGVIGVRGDWDGWNIVSSLSKGQHKVDRSYVSGLIGRNQTLENLSLTPEETQQHPAQYNSATLAKFDPFKNPTVYNSYGDLGQTTLIAMDTLASKEVFETDHGPVAIGLGLSARADTISYATRTVSTNRPAFSGKRHNMAVFGELQAPLTETLEATFSGRYDQYSDFGGVATSKAGWKWKTNANLFFRGSVGNGFRAPTLGQTTNQSTYISSIQDGGKWIPIYFQGNPALNPEKSTQKNFGFRFDPSSTWSLGMDWWELRISDTFGNISAEQILNTPALRNQYLTDRNGTLAILSPNSNLGRAHSSGIDYDIQWRKPTDWGVLRWSFKGTHFLQSERQFSNDSPFVSDLGQFSPLSYAVTPRNQWSMRTALDQGNWSTHATVNYRSGNTEATSLATTDLETIPFTHKVPSYWTLDIGGRWTVNSQLTLSMVVNNLLDKEPPLRLLTSGILQGVDTRYANYYGRTLKLKAEYKF
jgi:iron complex outermembrane receptor protein